MWLLNYIKEKGIKRAFVVLYEYKIDLFLQKIMSILFRKSKLKNIIIIMSHDDFDNNGGAFYDYLIKNHYNQKYKIVWILNHKKPDELPENVYGFKYLRPSIKKDYYICCAKILTADDLIIKKVKKDQKSYYLTHGHGGISIKNIGGITVLPDTVDYCLVSSFNIAEMNAKAWSIPYPSEKLINLGLPSNDVLFEKEIKTSHIVKKDEYNYIILWMPTFRKQKTGRNDSDKDYEYGIPLIETSEDMKKLKRYLTEKNYCLIIKMHPFQDENTYINLKKERSHNLIVLDNKEMKKREITNQQLYVLSDIMLNDYSSAMFPFLLLNRPMGFVLSDLKNYKRGISIENLDEFMVGEKIYTFAELIHFMDESASGKDSFLKKRTELRDYLYDYIDGNSCERIVKHMGL